MGHLLDDIEQLNQKLQASIKGSEEPPASLQKDISDLTKRIVELPKRQRAEAGQRLNSLKRDVQQWLAQKAAPSIPVDAPAIDLTAPFDDNVDANRHPRLMTREDGSEHPISTELDRIIDIFERLGFDVQPSRQLDDDYHMFTALNFPPNHPARDDIDTFITDEGLILPAQTSTMQNRVLKKYAPPIQVIIPGRVFRNEDLDATHEHTFYQVEGVVVDEGVTLAQMIGLIRTFLEAFFEEKIEFRLQPFYFPFVEPGMEVWIRRPKQLSKSVAEEWMEIIGCGMIHPNVLKEAGLDPAKYSGFAWGGGIDRMIMARNGIEDIRHFHSGRLDFLKQFSGSER